MSVIILIIALGAVVAILRAIMLYTLASDVRGKDVKEEFAKTIAYFRSHPIAGSCLIGLWVVQYILVVALLVVLVL